MSRHLRRIVLAVGLLTALCIVLAPRTSASAGVSVSAHSEVFSAQFDQADTVTDDAALVSAGAAIFLAATAGGSAVIATSRYASRDRRHAVRQATSEARQSLTECLTFADTLLLSRRQESYRPESDRAEAILALNRLEMSLIATHDHEAIELGVEFREVFFQSLMDSSRDPEDQNRSIRKIGRRVAEALSRRAA